MDTTSLIREKIDIVGFISEYMPVKRAGRNFNAICPFHNEKSPSFVISPERQIWHCFGCGKGGDAFTFLMEYEKLEFVEALRTLAKRTGVELKESAFEKQNASQKERLYGINRAALEFYHYVLTRHSVGKRALDYLLETRKINAGTINTYMLGYAPKSGHALSDYLILKKKFKKEDVIDAGLGFSRGRVVDFFINRIMFPLFDHRGNIIGFSGRVFDESSNVAKYVNTRETIIYHKGSVFFGLDSAKEEIKKIGKAIIVEGEFDVISCFQNSIKNVVAVKGTALTESQVSLLGRFTQKIALCFDQDNAGQEAIKRSLVTLEKKGITTTVVVAPSGKDADEALQTDPYGFKKAVQEDKGVYDYLLEKSLEKFGKKSIEGKQKIAEELLPFFAAIENEIVKEHYLRRLSTEIDTSYEGVVRQVEKIQRKETNTIQATVAKQQKRDRQEVLEEYILALILQYKTPKEIFFVVKNLLPDFSFKIKSYEKIFNALDMYLQNNEFSQQDFIKNLPTELTPAFDTCFLLPLPQLDDLASHEKEAKKAAGELRSLFIKSQIKLIGDLIKDKEKTGEAQEVEILQQKLARFASLLSASKNSDFVVK